MVPNHIALWSEKMFAMISIFLILPRFYLWPKVCSIPESISCALEKKAIFFCLVMEYAKVISTVNLMCDLWPVSILILSVDDQSIAISGVLKSPSIIFFFFCQFPLNGYLYLSYVYRCSYVGCLCIYNCNISFLDLSLYHYLVSFLVSSSSLYLKVCFIWYENWYCSFFFFLISICMEYLVPGPHF